jgi:hypothetical protein
MQSVNKPVMRHLPPTLSDADVKAQLCGCQSPIRT